MKKNNIEVATVGGHGIGAKIALLSSINL